MWGGGGGGGGGGGEKGISDSKKKKIGICLLFCAHVLYKISSSWLERFSSFHTNKRSNKRTGKGHNFANVLQKSVKSHLNMDPIQAILYILC